MLDVKQMIVASTVGRIALSVRDRFDLLRAAYWHPEFVGTLANDQLAMILVVSLCQRGKTFVDVGAHIGSVIASVIHRGDPSIKVVAIEAIGSKVTHLRRKFPAIELHGCAVGNLDGEVSFFLDTKQSGYSSLGRRLNADPSSVKEIRVPMRTMDGLLSHQDVDVIKIDVEGAELAVLEGGEQLITRSRPTIMFESAPNDPFTTTNSLGYTKEAMWDWFNAHDYALLVPNRVAHSDAGLSRDGFVEGHFYPRRTTNYFAIPNERRTEIQNAARGVLALPAS